MQIFRINLFDEIYIDIDECMKAPAPRAAFCHVKLNKIGKIKPQIFANGHHWKMKHR